MPLLIIQRPIQALSVNMTTRLLWAQTCDCVCGLYYRCSRCAHRLCQLQIQNEHDEIFNQFLNIIFLWMHTLWSHIPATLTYDLTETQVTQSKTRVMQRKTKKRKTAVYAWNPGWENRPVCLQHNVHSNWQHWLLLCTICFLSLAFSWSSLLHLVVHYRLQLEWSDIHTIAEADTDLSYSINVTSCWHRVFWTLTATFLPHLISLKLHVKFFVCLSVFLLLFFFEQKCCLLSEFVSCYFCAQPLKTLHFICIGHHFPVTVFLYS